MSKIEAPIFDNFQKHISLSDSEKSFVYPFFTKRTVLKKEKVLRQGQLCSKIFFVEKGSLRAFNINDEGKETTIMFALSDWWITDMDCFVNQQPSNIDIVALEDSIIMELAYSKLQTLLMELPVFERFFRILFQNAYIREQRRSFHAISLSTEERYHLFVDKYPKVVEKITQKQIASYLGVTPEFLSSIKKKSHS